MTFNLKNPNELRIKILVPIVVTGWCLIVGSITFASISNDAMRRVDCAVLKIDAACLSIWREYGKQ